MRKLLTSLIVTLALFLPIDSFGAVTLGVNAGFVTTAPTSDPTGSETTVVSNNAMALKVTVPADATTITEIGWYCQNAIEEANFEVGMYDHDAGNNDPNNVIGALDQTNAKGTDAGWKVVSGLSIDISSYQSAIVWIAFQLDFTSPNTNIDRQADSGERYSKNTSETTLTDPWSASSETADKIIAIYAVYETAAGRHGIIIGQK